MPCRLTRLFGIEFPIIQAPMAGVQGSTLAIAVSEAGGLGSLPCAMLSLEALEAELTEIRANTTKPINVNFFCHSEPLPQAAKQATWLEQLAPYFAEFNLDSSVQPAGAQRTPYSKSQAEVLAKFKPEVVSFHFGLPDEELLLEIKAWGSKVISTATTVEEALWLEAHGADAIIAQGLEAGGHRGHFLSEDLTEQLGTFSLLPQIIAAVDIPVIAAGGIVDAKTVRAAMTMGASAVQVGTAYLLCPECNTSAIHREALQSDAAQHTALTNLFSGRPARGIVNRFMAEMGPMNEAVPDFPLASSAVAGLRTAAERQGFGDFSPLWCGQNASGCRTIPAAELTRQLALGFGFNIQ
ncbi:nitronate monooxygenase [Shewanella xiamenensis]|uniref:NAD(P)H-dependent flavin oxidoreductase n=1 Tax=Shewanella xiamenensis TaxID=332186 RepID=UPI0016633D1B|nr:nitronate monooxygenase [Shewanella xiamenensis]MCL1072139.1 nitronate monooxygenase [Shewanella xiamenensis]MCR4532911.1 nitronate monooxygenase [Shewanella xiamenensis]WHF56085.1 nitronate monooxygenase [Shewanella xiamenensis]GGM99773.1 2-nitropropane dioxygenase [Shewanella xiamenensis]